METLEQRKIRQERDNLHAIVTATRSAILVAASRIRAYQSPAYDDRHDYQQPQTLKRAYDDLMDIYRETAELLARAEAPNAE